MTELGLSFDMSLLAYSWLFRFLGKELREFTVKGNGKMHLHVTFGGIFTIQQGLISCPLHWETTLKISAENDVILVGVLIIYVGNHECASFTTTRTEENDYTEYHVTEHPYLCITFDFRS